MVCTHIPPMYDCTFYMYMKIKYKNLANCDRWLRNWICGQTPLLVLLDLDVMNVIHSRRQAYIMSRMRLAQLLITLEGRESRPLQNRRRDYSRLNAQADVRCV